MSTKEQTNAAQEGWAGGWNLLNGMYMKPNAYASAINARIVNDGDLSARQGCQRYTAAALGSGAYMLGGFSWRQATGTTDLLVANGHLFTALCNSTGGGTPGYVSLVDRGAGLSTGGDLNTLANPRVSFAHFRDGTGECAYVADGFASIGGGTLPLSKWNGTTFTPHGVGPSGIPFRYIWVYNQRLFGVTGVDQTLYWSALNNGDTLGDAANGGGFATVRTFGAQVLIGGMAVGNTNFLWHQGAISLFRGTTFDDINISAGALGLASDVGVCSPFTAVAFDGYAIILTRRGMYLLTAGGGLTALDQPGEPDPTTRDTSTLTGGLASFGMYNWSVHNARYKEIWFGTTFIPSSATYLPVYVYNYRFGCWVGKFGFVLPGATYLTAAWETLDTAGIPQVILGCSDGYPRSTDWPLGSVGERYLDDILWDRTGGSAFAVSVQCRRFWGDEPSATKQWRTTDVAATLNGNASLLLTPGIQAVVQPNTINFTQPVAVSNAQPAIYRATTGGASQFLDLAYSWSSSPKLTLHRVEAEGAKLPHRGVAPPSPNIRLLGTLVLDLFGRTGALGNAESGQLWHQDAGVWSVASGLAVPDPTTASTAWVDALVSDCTVQATIGGTGPDWAIYFRYVNTLNWWRVVWQGGNWELQVNNAGIVSTPQAIPAAFSVGDVMAVVLNGNSILITQNGGTVFTRTDATFATATKHGMGTVNLSTTQRFDVFKVTVP